MLSTQESLARRNEFDANLVFGVRTFNEATGRDVHLAARKRAEVSALSIDRATGLVSSDMTMDRGCPLCGSRHGTGLFVKSGFPHLRCAHCRMVYVSPALREERLHDLYQGEDSYTRVLMNETQQVMDRKRYAYGLDVVGQIAPSRHALLDIGCGPGTFLEVARERGWGVTGLEWNSWCVRRVRSMGIDVVEVPIEQTGFQAGSFSCVSAWSVLEHVLNPAAFLQRIHRVLCDGGALLVMVPNIESLLVRVLHERAATFCGEMHVNFFSADTLRQMLERCGFEVVICETFLTELGTVNNYLSFEDPYFGEAASVLDAVTPAWIHEKLMGSQLFAVARALPARPTVRTRE